MIFTHILTDSNESNAFIVGCEETRQALLVDVGEYDPAIPAFLDEHGLRLTKVFITHDHYDHTGGLDQAVARDGAEVLAGSGSVGGLRATQVGHGDTVEVGRLVGTVLATPGHTPDGLCLAFSGRVFTGDTLFAGSVGGCSGAAHRQLLEGIKEHLFALPPDTQVHTGHGPSSTIAIESQHNPFFV